MPTVILFSSISRFLMEISNTSQSPPIFDLTVYSRNCSDNYTAPPLEVSVFYIVKIVTALLGFLLNLLSLVVFAKLRFRSTFICLLILLSAVEVTYGAGGLFFEIFFYFFIILRFPIPSFEISVTMVYSIGYVTWIAYKAFFLTRNWLIVLIAICRYRAITDPLRARELNKPRYVISWTAVILVISVALTVPRVFEFTFLYCSNHGVLDLKSTFFARSVYGSIYGSIFFLLTSPLPIVCVIYCSLRMLCYLRRQAQDLKEAKPTTQQRQTAQTRTIFILCSVFFVCEIPMFLAGVLKIAQLLQLVGQTFRIFNIYAGGIANCLTNLDSILNFVVYMSSLRNFKNDCKVVFQRCLCRQPKLSYFSGSEFSRRTSSITELGDSTNRAVLLKTKNGCKTSKQSF